MTTSRQAALQQFVDWCAKHISGDEKGEAQIFLDQLFRAFGHAGFKEAGAICEMRVKKAEKGISFADLVWKPVVLVEMKKRGEDLSKHYLQAFTYWTRLVPNRPQYVVLCNFDEFWIYDFNSQMDSPVDKVSLKQLPERFGPLAFLFAEASTPIFGNHQESVTRKAADQLVMLFRSLIKRGVDRELSQRFTLQALMALFAEDIGLLEKYFFTRLLDDCTTPGLAYDLIGQLFSEMNSPGKTTGGRFKGVPYFNGGLFADPARIELSVEEIELLRGAAKFDWSKVRPEIFGAIFEHSMDSDERRAFGAHYTSPVDIMKVVGPTIVEPWQQRIDSAKTLTELEQLLMRIENFRVLDPACGSGNFLYIAYRELKRLEARIYERMGEWKSIDSSQRPMGFVSTRNFFGMDINPFAVELAKVTMMLAHKLAIDELHIQEQALPLDNLDANFSIGDALMRSDGSRAPWPKADVIIGNPPFLGAKQLKPKHGADYVRLLRKTYPEVPGMADFCVYWFRRAEEHLSECTSSSWFSGRAGLVGTQNIRYNASRIGGLDAICATGTVIEAVDNQPWSGEANVSVSIVNWIKSQDTALLPKSRRLWFKIQQSMKGRKARGSGQASKDYELDMREVTHISSSLSDKIDVTGAVILTCNTSPKISFQGITPGHEAFLLSAEQVQALPSKERVLISPCLVGEEVLSGATERRYLLDFGQRSVLEAQGFPQAFAHVRQHVLPAREKAAEEGKDKDGNMRPHHRRFLERWWQLSWGRADMLVELAKIPRYLACSRVTKRPIFTFVDSVFRPGDALQVFALADDYSFGILQSDVHAQWFIAKCSKLTERPRYTSESVFDTFPWPQNIASAHVDAIANAGRQLRQVRNQALQHFDGSLRALYRTLDTPGKNPLRDAHSALNAAVLRAYGFTAKQDPLEELLKLNHVLATKIAVGEDVDSPGIPTSYPNPQDLLTDDAFGKAV